MHPVNLNAVALKMKSYPYFLLFFLVILLFSCKEESKIEQEIAKVPVTITVKRFDDLFANSTLEAIPSLKAEFPYLFPKVVPDSIWALKLKDTLQLQLKEEVDKTFGDFETEKASLESLFKHIKYYFPRYKAPKIVTLISEVQYDTRVVLTDSLLLIGLDNYLGADHFFYEGMSKYIAKGLDKQFLLSDVASAFAKKVNALPRNRTFLSRMVYHGKELYLKDLLLPNNTNAQKIGFTAEELVWAQNNEEQIWRYFIEEQLLYSTDSALDRRFLDPAPFSKFGLELDRESPGRLGRYIGWQIVKKYMDKNPEVSIVELLDMPADEIFKNSNYKPRK